MFHYLSIISANGSAIIAKLRLPQTDHNLSKEVNLTIEFTALQVSLRFKKTSLFQPVAISNLSCFLVLSPSKKT